MAINSNCLRPFCKEAVQPHTQPPRYPHGLQFVEEYAMVYSVKGLGEVQEHHVHIFPLSKSLEQPFVVGQEVGEAQPSFAKAVLGVN